MSQTNDLGEENDQRDPLSEDFEFYFPFAKTLALDLPTPEDTSIAAAWIQKLEAEPESEEEKRTRLNYLKLLLFVLQRGRLIGMFRKQPPSGPLQPFPQGFSVLDMGNLMLEQDDTPTCGEGDVRCLPYNIEISNDLREFVASQEIPNFGVQMYYAWSSDEPVHKWSSFDEEKFPQYVLDKIQQLKEVRSDEKSTVGKNGCLVPRTGCDLPLIEKCGKKKVKSPQEIEKSQGRSFQTYVGLVGRMGNFSDKCGDDPEKCQRQDPRKGKCPRKNVQKRYPGSGGEAEEMPMEDELANLIATLGGLNALNRPCLCPTPGVHPHYPEPGPKGGPQYGRDQDQLRVNYTYPLPSRRQLEDSPWDCPDGRSPSQPRYSDEPQCPEKLTPQPMPTQRRSPSPRPVTISPNRPNFDCPPQDDGGFRKQEAVCCCTSPPCTCPCPRSVSQVPTRKPPSAPGGGRGNVDPGLACTKQGYRREDPCAQGPDPGPSGSGRPGLGQRPTGRKKSPEIIHCYDSQNPDPNLTRTVSKLDSINWPDDIDDDVLPADDMKTCYVNEQAAQPAFQRTNAPQRQGYGPCQEQEVAPASVCPTMPGMKQKSDRYSPTPIGQRLRPPPSKRSPRTPSPQGASRPVCQTQLEVPQQTRPHQQFAVGSQQYAQNYQEGARPDVCGRPAADPCRPQAGNQIEDLYAFSSKSPQTVSEPSPAGLTGRPPQGRPGAYDVCQPPQTGNQIEDLCAFLNKSPPKSPRPSPPPQAAKPPQGRPGSRDACARPAADPCTRQTPQPSNQAENIYAFLDRFPPDVPGLTPPGYENVFRIPAINICEPTSPHWNEPQNLYEFADKFPPSAIACATAGYEPEAPAAEPSRPPTGNQFEDLCAFLNQSPPKAPTRTQPPAGLTCKPAPGRPGPFDGGRPAAGPCAPPTQTKSQMEDLCALMNKSLPKSPGPSGLSGRPPQTGRPYDVCGAPASEPCGPPQTGNQIEDLCAFLSAAPPKAARPSPAPQAKPAQSRPGSRDACARPAADPCGRQTPQPSNQAENIYAFLDKFPPDVPGLTPPGYEDVFGRPAKNVCEPTSPHWNEPQNLYEFSDRYLPGAMGHAQKSAAVTALLQGMNQRREASRDKCEQQGTRKPPNNVGTCSPSGQPQATVCPKPASGGATASNYCPESRPVRNPACPDTGTYRRQPMASSKTGNVESCTRNPPGRAGANIPVSFQGKAATSTCQQPVPSRQPMHPSCPPTYGQEACEADEEEEDECESSESAEEVCPKQCEQTYGPPAAPQKGPGRPPQQALGSSREPMQVYGPQAKTPGMAPQQDSQGSAVKWAAPKKAHTQDTGFYREPSGQSGIQWMSFQGQGAEEEYNEDWDDMPSSASQMAKHGYGNESIKESQKKDCPSGKASPGKLSKQESKVIEGLGPQGPAFQLPSAGPGSRKGSLKGKEPPVQSCPPQKACPGKSGAQDQTPEEWCELGSGFSDRTLSEDTTKDDETPTCQPLVWGNKVFGGQKDIVIQGGNLPPWISSGRVVSQEQAQSCPQPGTSSQRISKRPQPSQNKLSQKKSSSRTRQSLTDSKSKAATRSKPSPSKSDTRSNNCQTAIKPKPKMMESKAKPKIKSETQMKIRPEIQLKVRPVSQMKIKSDPNMKCKSHSKMRIKCVLMDLSCERKTPPPTSYQNQQRPCVPYQEKVAQDCPTFEFPSYSGNPYVERSILNREAPCRSPVGKASTPKQWSCPISQDNVPTYSTINQYESTCQPNEMNEDVQINFYEDDDENIEYMPLYSLNADLTGGKFFNLPETGAQSQQCPPGFRPSSAPERPKGVPLGVTFQRCPDEDTYEYCDNTNNNFY